MGEALPTSTVNVLDRLAYIMGTSACIMATTDAPRFVPGVWGPYFSAMVPGLWLNEGGQSAAGAGIDHLLRSHPAHGEAVAAAKNAGLGLLEFLERRAVSRFETVGAAAMLARGIHILPEFLGNRSPHADPHARAVVAGLDLGGDIENLERLFVAGLCGLAYGLADVVDVMRSHGIPLPNDGNQRRGEPQSRSCARSWRIRPVWWWLCPHVPSRCCWELPCWAQSLIARLRPLQHAMSAMSGLASSTQATPPAMTRFHSAKRQVHALMRRLDTESRMVMQSSDANL